MAHVIQFARHQLRPTSDAPEALTDETVRLSLSNVVAAEGVQEHVRLLELTVNSDENGPARLIEGAIEVDASQQGVGLDVAQRLVDQALANLGCHGTGRAS
jgi:hypothetical protein